MAALRRSAKAVGSFGDAGDRAYGQSSTESVDSTSSGLGQRGRPMSRNIAQSDADDIDVCSRRLTSTRVTYNLSYAAEKSRLGDQPLRK